MKNLISHINNATPTRELSLFEKIYVKVKAAIMADHIIADLELR